MAGPGPSSGRLGGGAAATGREDGEDGPGFLAGFGLVGSSAGGAEILTAAEAGRADHKLTIMSSKIYKFLVEIIINKH